MGDLIIYILIGVAIMLFPPLAIPLLYLADRYL